MLLCAPPPPARESDWSRHCCCAAQHTGWRVGSLNGTCRRAPLLQLFLRDPLGAAADPGFGVISPSALMRIIPTSSLKAPSCPLSPASPRQAQGSIASAPPPSTHTHTDTTPFQWVYFKWTADTTLGLWEGAAQQRPPALGRLPPAGARRIFGSASPASWLQGRPSWCWRRGPTGSREQCWAAARHAALQVGGQILLDHLRDEGEHHLESSAALSTQQEPSAGAGGGVRQSAGSTYVRILHWAVPFHHLALTVDKKLWG